MTPRCPFPLAKERGADAIILFMSYNLPNLNFRIYAKQPATENGKFIQNGLTS